MKTAIAFFGFLFLFIGVQVQAQTKEETEKWIVEKINKLKSAKKYTDFYKERPAIEREYVYYPGMIEIKKDSIIFQYSLSYRTKILDGTDSKPSTYSDHIKCSAPLNQISSIAITLLSKEGTRTSSGDTWLVLCFASNCVTEIKSNGESKKVTCIDLFIHPNAEEDIANRLEKAFIHLKTFYPKPKETF